MATFGYVSEVAIVIWQLTWLPGIFVLVIRITKLLQSDRRERAIKDALLISSIPATAWLLYSWSGVLRGAPADVVTITLYLLQIVVPYFACSVTMYGLNSRMDAPAVRAIAIFVGFGVIMFFAPGPFLSLLMALSGGG